MSTLATQTTASNRINGYYLSLQYIGPRKRKPIRWASGSGIDIDKIFQEVKEWRAENGGRFISGMIVPCQFEDVVYEDGTKCRWKFVACFQPSEVISEELISSINV